MLGATVAYAADSLLTSAVPKLLVSVFSVAKEFFTTDVRSSKPCGKVCQLCRTGSKEFMTLTATCWNDDLCATRLFKRLAILGWSARTAVAMLPESLSLKGLASVTMLVAFLMSLSSEFESVSTVSAWLI